MRAKPANSELQLEVNGASYSLAEGGTVQDLLVDLELAGKRVAVALNRAVVIRSRYESVELSSGDRVEILEAVGGG